MGRKQPLTAPPHPFGVNRHILSGWRTAPASAPAPARERAAPRPRASSRQTPMEALTKSVLRTAGSTITRELLRGVLGSLKRR